MTFRRFAAIATLLIGLAGPGERAWAQYSQPLQAEPSAGPPSYSTIQSAPLPPPGTAQITDETSPGEWQREPRPPRPIGSVPNVTATVDPPSRIALPPDEGPTVGPEEELPSQFRRTLVDYRTTEPIGTIIVDTSNTYLYLVVENGKAMRYGIGVGREGFTWAGSERISRMAEWPDWHPPAEMIERQPYLPRFMAGGEGNPLGARALYLGKSLYRIHGTNEPSSIGTFVSSGCIRLINQDISDLYARVQVGTRVVVLAGGPAASPRDSTASARSVPPAYQPTTSSRPMATNPLQQSPLVR